ncbi:hypothetical protein ASH00_06455 [Arthrobacter sp. Soil782]|uniref:DUF1990 family protein n=1 Tax=Arthrobacter sp. Soil782 TaxID=1736410 RepID=UPI0006F65F42|nr:DUF1990 domain-containing protein [Arthrobacter sp. Soil782]KRF09270.1 hypothetical protein ASH00_06455 [Arthrobacter sp. Soil782]
MPDITHTAIGWTRLGAWPAGFRPMRHRIRVGTGEAAFRRLAEGILTFELHRRSNLRITAEPRAAVGGSVTVGFGVGNLRLNAPCEVVWVEEVNPTSDDDGGAARGARRAGFGYATLPGHPETGEESFVAVLEADGSVFFELHAYSRHGNWFYRLGAPVARFCQELATRWYLNAARQLAAGPA